MGLIVILALSLCACGWRRVSPSSRKATSDEADMAYAPFLRIALVLLVL